MSRAYIQMRLAAFVSGLCGLLALPPGAAAVPVDPGAGDVPMRRPRIGLVLAGGGAKGGAHVGVLKVLEEQRVPIDCIAGTSMGALVGAGYASGLPVAELEEFVTGIDWQSVVGGVGRRSLQPIEQKRLETAAGASGELGFKKGQIVTPGGLTNTSAIDDVLRSYVARARMEPDFDQLPIPYRAIATDMVTGEMVVLKSGDLATAMRASMAIPGAFAPVAVDNYILADGGMVRNIPVDIARETCADVVIVVNLVEPSTPPERLVQATQLLMRSMDVMLVANERAQLATLTERDILIDVPTGDIGTADFMRIRETIPLGESAARLVVDRLASLAVPEHEYLAWRERVTTEQAVETRVADVRVERLDRVNADYLGTFMRIRPGDTVDIAAISADASQMSALDDIETVAYRFEGDLDEPGPRLVAYGSLDWTQRRPAEPRRARIGRRRPEFPARRATYALLAESPRRPMAQQHPAGIRDAAHDQLLPAIRHCAAVLRGARSSSVSEAPRMSTLTATGLRNTDSSISADALISA